MILQALNRYYDILSKDPESNIAPQGYSTVGVSFALNISSQGELLDVFSLMQQKQRGKKLVDVPKRMIVPEQLKKTSGIYPNFLCENSAYVLGISNKDAIDPEFVIERFETFHLYHKELLVKADCEAARAVIAFLDKYDPQKGREYPAIASHLEGLLKGGNLVFMLRGAFVQDDATIRKVWEAYKSGQDTVMGQCLVTGEIAPIARLHARLKGIRYANTTGASLVGFNGRAYESYNRVNGQGLNAPVSEKATFAYTTALNYLLSSANPNKQFSIGNSTVVYWAESEKKEYAATFSSIFEPEYVEQPTDDVEGPSGKIAGKVVRRVQSLDLNILRNGLNDSTRFYVLGLSPNAGRTSVRFFVDDSFDKIIGCILQNYDDLRIIKEYENQPTYITVGQILSETVSKRAQDKDASPLMAGSVMRAILTGAPYPAALYYAIINRIRRDMDDPQNNIKKISYARAAIIKAYFLRKYRNQSKYQEVLGMSLNEQSIIPAYVLGRLFAVLEKVQQEAIGEMNATIKDRYFTSVCASPARIFPVLLRLSQYQISKTKYGNAYKRRIQDLLNLLDVEKKPIPVSMSLDEQGIFVLGYYHQRVDLYIPRTDKNLVEVDPSVTN